jgi:hypothetical protein
LILFPACLQRRGAPKFAKFTLFLRSLGIFSGLLTTRWMNERSFTNAVFDFCPFLDGH